MKMFSDEFIQALKAGKTIEANNEGWVRKDTISFVYQANCLTIGLTPSSKPPGDFIHIPHPFDIEFSIITEKP